MSICEVEDRIKEIEKLIGEQQNFARQINNAILMLEGAKQENIVRLKRLQEAVPPKEPEGGDAQTPPSE